MSLTSNKLSIVKVKDGHANQYVIKTNVNNILKFVGTNNKFDLTVEEISISVLDQQSGSLIPYELMVGSSLPFYHAEINIRGYNFTDLFYEEDNEHSTYNLQRYLMNPGQESDPSKQYYYLRIGTLYNDLLANNTSAIKITYDRDQVKGTLLDFFSSQSSEDILITCSLYEGEEVKLEIEKYLQLQNGVSSEMAQFNLNVTGINMAIANTGLDFDSTGLSIVNGGFTIYNNEQKRFEDRIFYIDEDNNQLVMNGSGTFTGTVYAENGSFAGTISAANGDIGGFTIDQNSIFSGNDRVISNLIICSGETGIYDGESYIKVKNIDIGTGATIGGQISTGNLIISNPSISQDNKVIDLFTDNKNYFTLYNNGDIIGDGWSIQKVNGQTVASFARGEFSGTIHANEGDFRNGYIYAGTIDATTFNVVNFVTNNQRSMGGQFIFSPSFNIISAEDNSSETSNSCKFVLKDADGYLKGGDSAYISGNITCQGQIINTDTINDNIFVIIEFDSSTYTNVISNLSEFKTLMKVGQEGGYIIGINSDNKTASWPARALSILKIVEENNSLKYEPALILGDLSDSSLIDIYGDIDGYGLYADHVILRGSLVTEIDNTPDANSYAGISTINQENFDYNIWARTSGSSLYPNEKIVFWGGAENASSLSSSPFVVTDKGSVFASKGVFKGAVLSDSLITDTLIQTPVIYGSGNSPSLKIYDANSENGGISFYKKNGEIDTLNVLNDAVDEAILNISTTGFKYKDQQTNFIDFTNNTINISANSYASGNLRISGANGIWTEAGALNLNGSGSIINLASNTISIESNQDVNIKRTVNIINGNGEGKAKIKYTTKQVSNKTYYCVYVEEETIQSS